MRCSSRLQRAACSALLVAMAVASDVAAREKGCRYDAKPVREGLPTDLANLVGVGDGVIMAQWDAEAGAVVLEWATTGEKFGTESVARPKLEAAEIRALVETASGFSVLYSGTLSGTALETWQICRFDDDGIPDFRTVTIDALDSGAVLVDVIDAGGRLVLLSVQGESDFTLRVVAADGSTVGAPVPIPLGFDAIARLGNDLSSRLSVFAPSADRRETFDAPSLIFVFDTAAATWSGEPRRLDRIVADAAPLARGALVIATRILGKKEVVERALVNPTGEVGKWRRWHTSKANSYIGDVHLLADRGGAVVVTYYTARHAKVGLDDKPTSFVGLITDKGMLRGKPANKLAGPQPFLAAATANAAFILADRGLFRVRCR